MRKGIFRYIFSVLLLGVGFLVGTSWRDRIPQSPDAVQEEVTREASPRLDLLPQERHTISLFEKAAPSVVFINTSSLREDFFSRNVYEIPRGSGSGFIWDTKGHIVTNFHVVRGASIVKVTLEDGSIWDASLIGSAPEKDLAVLKIGASRQILSPVPLGESHDLQVGQSVYAIGNPFGLDQTLTTGIISAMGREIKGLDGSPIRDVIQTDAAINPGNSGGPLLDSSGRLIGVNTAIYSPSGGSAGIGFSIPVDVAKWVVPDLIAYGKLTRPSLGATYLAAYYASRYGIEGALIMNLEKGGAAEKAGLQATKRSRNDRVVIGDIIKRINDDNIRSEKDLQLALEKYKIGDVIEVVVERDGKEVRVTLELEEKK